MPQVWKLWFFSFFQKVAAALIRLLVLENIFLIPSHDVYLLVGACIKYRVAKIVQGRMTGKVINLFLRLTFPTSLLLTAREAPLHRACKILSPGVSRLRGEVALDHCARASTGQTVPMPLTEQTLQCGCGASLTLSCWLLLYNNNQKLSSFCRTSKKTLPGRTWIFAKVVSWETQFINWKFNTLSTPKVSLSS